MTMNDCDVFLLHHARFPKPSQLTRHRCALRHQCHATGFAIKAVDQMRLGISPKIQSHATDEAGIFVPFGWMTDEIRRFVDDQQLCVLVNDVEKLVQVKS